MADFSKVWSGMAAAEDNVQFAKDERDATLREFARLQARLAEEEENIAWCEAELAELVAEEAELEAEEAEEVYAEYLSNL